MHILKDVTNADYLEDYRLVLTFEDGLQKVVDLEPHLGRGVFLPLREVEFFKRVKVNNDTGPIEWPNVADFSPDFLYEIGKSVEQSAEQIQHD
jgi:hypothetical protein